MLFLKLFSFTFIVWIKLVMILMNHYVYIIFFGILWEGSKTTDALGFIKPFQQHLPQHSGRPLPEVRAVYRLHAISHGNDDIKII